MLFGWVMLALVIGGIFGIIGKTWYDIFKDSIRETVEQRAKEMATQLVNVSVDTELVIVDEMDVTYGTCCD